MVGKNTIQNTHSPAIKSAEISGQYALSNVVTPTKLEKTYHYGKYVDECLMLTNYDAQGTGTTVYPQCDRQYSVRTLADASGNIVESYDYSPMGKMTTFDANGSQIAESAYGNSYGYTGRRLDTESGLWYFRARYYSDDLGRFLSRDPAGYVDGMSLYAGYFAEQFGMDPLGQSVEPCKKYEESINTERCGVIRLEYTDIKSEVPPEADWSTYSFKLNAQFKDDPENGYYCRCCEVRQYIKFSAVPPHAGFAPPEDQPGIWYEDRGKFNNEWRNRYGHRSDYDKLHYYQFEPTFKCNQEEGCYFMTNDSPSSSESGGIWEFMLVVIDTCNFDSMVESTDTMKLDFTIGYKENYNSGYIPSVIVK